MLKKAVVLLSSNAFTSLMSLIRNLLIARLIGVEDYGIAATFAISMAVVEMMSTLGLQQLIIQDPDGHKKEMQAGLHGFHLARSLVSAAILFFLAPYIANFLGIPEVSWAYQVLAVVPVLNGLMHFDVFRKQREMVFWPFIITTSLSIFLSVLLVLPLYWWFGDFRIMLFSIMFQSLATLVLSHLIAERPYVLSLSRSMVLKSINFGWPLLINNIFLFIVFNGEKIVVGRELGMAALAIFSMGVTLTLTPTLVVAKSVQSFFLPQLTKHKDDAQAFHTLAMATMQSSLANGLLVVAVIFTFGHALVDLLLGADYAPLVPLITWFAFLHAIRVFKAGSSVVALSHARTSNAMIANLFRVLSVPISWYAAIALGDPLVIIWIATIAEILGYMASVILVKLSVGLPLGRMVLPIGTSVMALAVAAGLTWFTTTQGASAALPVRPDVIVLVLIVIALASMQDLQRYVREQFAART